MLWAEGHPAVAVAEHRAAYLGGVVFECKVPVTGSWLREIRNFAADPNLSHLMLKQQTNRLIQATNGKNCRGLRR